MPLALVTTPGAPDANAYADLAQVQAVAAYRGAPGSAFLDLTQDEQIAAIATMAAEMDAAEFLGRRLSTAQALAWPRTGAGAEGDGGIPHAIVRANIEGAILRAPSFDGGADAPAASTLDPDRRELTGVTVGALKLQFATSVADAALLSTPALAAIAHLPLIVQRLLAPYLARSGAGYGASLATRGS